MNTDIRVLRQLLVVVFFCGLIQVGFGQGLQISGDVTFVMEGNVHLVVDGDIEVDTSMVNFQDNADSKIHLTGDFITSEKHVSLDGSIITKGTEDQQLINGNLSIAKIIIDNPLGIVMDGLVEVRDSVTFINGHVITGPESFAILESTQIEGVNEDNHVQGPLNIITSSTTGSQTLFFPIGVAQEYRPVTLKFRQTQDSSNTYTASVLNNNFPSLNKDESLDSLSQHVYWSLSSTTSNNMDNGKITLWVSSADSLTTETAVVAKAGGSIWSNLGANDFTDIPGQITSDSSFSDLGYFAVGNKVIKPFTVSITSDEDSPTNKSPFNIKVSFSEAATGFDHTDLIVSNGTAGNSTSSDNITFEVPITPASEGEVRIAIDTGIATNPAGKNNLAATDFVILFDSTHPSVTISSNETDPTTNNPFNVIVTFSEQVAGFYKNDLNVTNGTAGNASAINNVSFTVPITPMKEGEVSIGLPASKCKDAAGNNNLSATSFTIRYNVGLPDITQVVIPNEIESGSANFEVSATVTDEGGVASVSCLCRKFGAGEDQWQSTPMAHNGDDVYSASISTATNLNEIGGQCYINAVDISDLVSSSLPQGVFWRYPPISLDYHSFGNQLSNYRIISIPYDLDDMSIRSIFEDDLGEYKKEWRILQYSNNSFREYPSLSRIEHGKGYWLIIKENSNVDLGTGTSFKTDPFVMNLTNGWNQIGNPYPFNLSWDKVLANNENTENLGGLIMYNGSWSRNNTQIKEQQGGFVYLDTNSLQLEIPANINSLSGGRIAKEDSNPAGFVKNSSGEWQVTLTLRSGEFVYNIGGLGMMQDASENKDRYDEMTLPRFMTYLEYYTHHPKHSWGKFTRDIRPLKDNGRWDIEISHNTGEDQIEISWDPLLVGQLNKDLVLYDPSTNAAVMLAHEKAISISTSHNKGNFSIIYGDNAFIKNNLVPNELVLGDPYPNPFSQFLNIPIGLPANLEDDDMYIDIFNLFGQHVTSIRFDRVDEHQTVLQWDGRDGVGTELSDGVYLLKIRDEQVNQGIKKIIKHY